jgi:anti-sigma regulatory factor (Ser/Thr protein kinase)
MYVLARKPPGLRDRRGRGRSIGPFAAAKRGVPTLRDNLRKGVLQVADEVDLEVNLPRAETAPAVARQTLTHAYVERVGPNLLDDAKLLVSELTSNALRHGRGEITLRARLDDNRLLVEVIDAGSGFERALLHRDFPAVGGWGLEIVEDVASRWGVHEGTTHVWFELEQPGPRLGERDDDGA